MMDFDRRFPLLLPIARGTAAQHSSSASRVRFPDSATHFRKHTKTQQGHALENQNKKMEKRDAYF